MHGSILREMPDMRRFAATDAGFGLSTFASGFPNDGSPLITQTDRILRISGFAVPEPASVTPTATGLAGLLVHDWRRRRSGAG
jgi:hypothetical protein